MTHVCLQMDVGNSSAKWRLVVGDSSVAQRGEYSADDTHTLRQLLSISTAPDKIWISSVADELSEAKLRGILVGQWGVEPWFARSEKQTNGLVNSYANPARMGVDRWLAMLAAREQLIGRICIVDAGSALTIDVVAANGLHEGGYILPGPALMERALLFDTDRVRFSEEADYELTPGKSTAEAVRHGIALAQTGAVRLALAQLDIAEGQLVLCGGGGETLQLLLGGAGLLSPDLVFEGLTLMAQTAVH
ncbi:MAG: type III pantothenate kinase [Halioglobus sp.]|jgi:type III pantothenate kinase